jgi:ABC-type glycerol-3-phosphate transport system substrate-binding protein
MTMPFNRRTMLKGAGASTLAATMAGTFAGLHRIANAAAQNGPVAIEYWHRNGGDTAVKIQEMADRFNTEFGDRVTVTPIFQNSIAELNQKIRAAALGGGLPGATMADDYDITQYAFNDILAPLDDYINDPENGFTADELADFLPYQLNRHKLDIYDGKTMAFPQAFSCFATWWNVDALEKAGYDAPPALWPDFPDVARKIGEANPGMQAWVIGGAGDRLNSCIKTYGVNWLKDGGQESNYDAPEVLEILTWWKELSDEGLLSVATESDQDVFKSGGSAFYMNSSASVTGLSLITDFRWNGTLPPQGPNVTEKVTETYGPVNAIPKNDPEIQLAGWLWIKWLASIESLSMYIPQTSYFPSRTSVVDAPELTAFYEQYPVAKTLYNDIAPLASILTPSPALAEVRGTISANVVNELLAGRLSPEDAQQKLKAEADDAITRALGN